jgi:DNA-binding NtrC family response regulator/tetratricopeptide (TPR) repeat protein
MHLVADRFASDDNGDAVDLATGARVLLIAGSAGGVSEQLRWNARCDTLHALRHRAIAPLVDFGLVGECSQFEAWGCGRPWRGSADEARSVHARATRFLRAMCVSAGNYARDCVKTTSDGVGTWVPDAGSGYPAAGPGAREGDLPLCDRGTRWIDRPVVASLSEMFRLPSDSRSQIANVWGPPGAGKRSVVRALARTARLNGFVPVAAHLVDSPYADLWRDRSLCVIASDTDLAPWSVFLRASLRIAQPHVLLIAGETECRAVDGVALHAVTAEALVSAVQPSVRDSSFEAVVLRAAERAQGLPGRFVRALWRGQEHANRGRTGYRRASMVAEQPAVYGRDDALCPSGARAAVASAWPAPGELAALRRRLDVGSTQLAGGRHASGIRELRQAVGGLARRGAWTEAAGGGLQLASALLRRGRARDAHAAIDEAREYAGHAGGDALLIDLSTLSGEAWIDLARLDEAEGILATALTAARAGRDPSRIAAASLTLSRCLFWRGRYAEAATCLQPFPDAMPWHVQVRHAIMSSRIAMARRDFSVAMSQATLAAQQVSEKGAQPLCSSAATAYASAFVHLAVGDLDAADREIAASIAGARAAHDPLRAVRARLLRAEVERRRGRAATAASQLERLRRVMATAPPLLRARWQLATALSRADRVANVAAIVERHVAATGLGALAAYAIATPAGGSGAEVAGDAFLEHLVGIVRVCQTAEDDTVVLKEVCGRVRQHLHAASVAFVAIRDGRTRVLAADGARLDSDIAERATSAAMIIAPHRRDDRIEAAAPVLYGGVPIAAVCARWTLGSTYDTSRAAPVLTMTAAAAAPIVALAIARTEDAPTPGGSELLGVSPAIVELRRSVACAAAAPFAVLIDGESGSGKELVARAIHRSGPRRHKAICTLNCAALPDDLVEAELFGHARGSFTGAVADRAGVFEDAHGGTLFLDEIGELSPRAQAKVLRVIQEGELRRVGETSARRVDVRIIAATNRDLRREVEGGRFRLDLLYRLDVVHIAVPRLRDRREDVAVLAEHFWRDAAARVGSRATLGAPTIAALARHDWPGNVRELQNVLAALAVRCPKRGIVPPSALPPAFGGSAAASAWRLDEARRTFDERFVRAALVRTGGHRGRAAEELGVTRQGLTKLMTRLGISP